MLHHPRPNSDEEKTHICIYIYTYILYTFIPVGFDINFPGILRTCTSIGVNHIKRKHIFFNRELQRAKLFTPYKIKHIVSLGHSWLTQKILGSCNHFSGGQDHDPAPPETMTRAKLLAQEPKSRVDELMASFPTEKTILNFKWMIWLIFFQLTQIRKSKLLMNINEFLDDD